MKHLLLSLCFVFIVLFSFGQKEANVWYFGMNAGVDFNSGSPVALTNGKLNTNEGCASIADKTTGQLLFYTDGITVYDRTHAVMLNGSGLKGNTSSTQSGVIVPMPGSTTQFYIFTVDAQAGKEPPSTTGFGGVAYSIVDMTLNGGNGAVTTLNTTLLTPTCEKITAVRHCDGKDIWIIIHQWNSDAFYAYLLTAFGISAPVITHSGIVHEDVGSGQNSEAIGYMKFSPDGKKLALNAYNNLNTLQIFDFDNTTGVISNPFSDTNFPDPQDYNGPYGISFSPDNSRLYVGVYGYSTTPSYVYQYNMLAGSGAAIIASRTQVASRIGYGLGALQIGPDGRIYVAQGDETAGTYLDVIKNPNALGTACNYTNNVVYLGGKLCKLGLPDLVESFVGTPYTATLNYPICTGNDSVSFVDNTINGNISVYWDFGDSASGGNNSSALQNATHTFSSSGTYTVTLFVSNDCTTDTIVQTVTVSGGEFTVNAGSDVTICSNDSTQLNVTGAPGGSTISWSPSTGLTCTNCANPFAKPTNTTTYIVTINSGGCTGQDTVIVNVAPSLDAVAGPDTIICAGNAVQLYASGGTSYSWSPSTGLTDSSVANPQAYPFVTTTYTVTVSGGTCASSKTTVTITVAASPPVPNITQSGDTLYCGFDPTYTAYQWYFNSTPVPGATLPYFVESGNGNYNVAVSNEDGCSVSVGIIILGIQNEGFDSKTIYLSSNSVHTELTINGDNIKGKVLIGIYDILGRNIYYSEETTGGSLRKLIDVSGFSSGVYFVELRQTQRRWVGKFVKE